ncbi:hypothetical protein BDW75DRAFT_240620 [Aspergillus navahoensis]
MKAGTMSLLIALILTIAILQTPLIHAQIRYDSKTNHVLCPAPNTQYCGAVSLRSSSIISCTPQGTVEIRSCEAELSSILPAGYEGAAVCYESSSRLGNAVCAFNGTGYTLEGLEVDVPETVLCDDIPSFPFIDSFAKDHSDRGEEVRDGVATIGDPYGSRSPVSILRGYENLARYSSYFPVPSVPHHLSIPTQDAGLIATCSNPWSRQDAKAADILTLDIVLVIPTTRVKAAGPQSQPFTSNSTIPSVPVLTTASTGSRTTLIPSCNMTSTDGISGHCAQTTLSTEATLTPWGDATMDSNDESGAHETGVSNSGVDLRTKIAMSVADAVLMLILWTSAGTLFG